MQLQTKDPGLWLNRSIVNRHLENWEDAEEEAEIACELQPSNPKAFYSRAVAFQHMGKLQRALSCCKKGLSAQADNKALLQLQNLLTRQLAEKQASEDPDRLAKRSSKSTKQVVEEAVDENSCPVSRVNDNEIEGIKQKALNTMYEWKDGNPSRQERDGLKKMLTDAFRGKYEQLRQQAAAAEKSKGTVLQTDQYDKLQKQGLQLKGGHQPMKRPDHVELPPDFKEPSGLRIWGSTRSVSSHLRCFKYKSQNAISSFSILPAFARVLSVNHRSKARPMHVFGTGTLCKIATVGRRDAAWRLLRRGLDRGRCSELAFGHVRPASVASALHWYLPRSAM